MKVLRRKSAAGLPWLRSLIVTGAGLGCVLGLGVIDYFTPGPMSFVLCYMLVVVAVAWRAGKWHALFISSLAVITMATVQWGFRRGAPQSAWVALWNYATRFLVFCVAGWLTAELTRLTRHLSELVEERTAQWKAEAEQHQATATRLAEALERFEQVINNITEVFWLSDLPGYKVSFVSPGYERIWGRKSEDLYGDPKSWLAALHPDDRAEISRRFAREQAAGGYDVEYRILRPDGAVRWIRDRAFPVRNQQGEVYRIAGIAEDITERKQSREALQTQAAILESMAEAVVVTDERGVIVQMNPAGERIWGYEHGEVLGRPASLLSALPEPEAEAVMSEVREALGATGAWRGTFRNRRKDGAVILCEAVVSPLAVQGRLLLVAVEQEVTERLRAQEQLQIQARVLESMAEAVVMVDELGTILLTNPALDALLGYEPGELAGQSMQVVAGYAPGEYDRVFRRSLEQVKAHGATAEEYLARRKDGTLLEVQTRSSGMSVGGRFCLVVVGQDITERKRAEQALRQSEETLRVFLDALPEPAMLLDREGMILLANRALANGLGQPEGELLGQYVFNLLPARVAEARKATFDQVVRTRQPAHHEDARGSRHFMSIESPVLDAAGNVTRVAVCSLDITQRKTMESALVRQEALYRTLFELSPDGILLEDIHGNILDVNQALCQSFGYSRAELVGQNVRCFVPPDGLGEVEAHLAALRAGQELEHEVWNVRKQGERCRMRLNEKPLALPDGRRGILVVTRDITETKRGELIKEVFLSLGAKLSGVRTPEEAARAIYASADQLWQWDAATLSLYSPETDTIDGVLFCDLVDGQRRDVPAVTAAGPPTARSRQIMQHGAQLLLRREAEMQDSEAIRFGDVTRLSASIMYVPLRRDGQPVGVLSIQSYTPKAYGLADLRTLQALADYCGGALERIRIEQALQQREETNRAMLATAMDGFLAVDFGADAHGAIVAANDAYCRLTGYSREELCQMKLAELEIEDSPEQAARRRERILTAGAERFETRHRRKNGQVVHVEVSVSRLAGSDRTFGFVRDITERKRAELMREGFLSLGAKLSAARTPADAGRAIYALADRLWRWDCGVLDLHLPQSGQLETVLAYDVLEGQRRELALAEAVGPVSAMARRVMAQGAELILRQPDEPPAADTIPLGDTSRLSASIMCVPVRGESQVVGVLSVQSYTPEAYTREDLQMLQALADYCAGALERLGADTARRQSEELLRAFYDSPGGLRGIVELLEDDLLVVSANAPQAEAYGREPGAMQPARASELGLPRPTLDLWLQKFRECQESKQPVTFDYPIDYRSPGGWGMTTVSPLNLARTGRPRLAYVAVDVTERKRAEVLKEALLSLGAKLNAAKSPVEAARAVYGAADQLWRWDSATLNLYSPETDGMYPVLNCDVVDGQRGEVPAVCPGAPPSARMRRILQHEAELVLEPLPSRATDLVPFGDTARLSASMMYVPLRGEGQPIGVLSIQSYTPNAYTREDLRTLQLLADHCGGALQRIQAEVALREAHDQLERRVHERTAELQEANAALGESEQKYRRLYESMRDAFVTVELGGRITEFNPAYQALLGYTAEELHDLTYADLTPQKWHALEARIVAEQVLPQGYSEVYEKEYRRKDGTIFPVELRAFLIRDTHDQPAAMWAIVRDITRRKLAAQALREAHDQLEARVQARTAELETANAALRESEERYRSLVTNLNIGVYRNTPDAHGRFLHVNPALARMHGYDSVDEFQQTRVADHYQDPGERKALIADLLRRGAVANYEVRLKKRDGTPIYGMVNATVHRGPDGAVDWIDGVLEDITERKRAEQSLAEALDLNRTLVSASTVGIAVYKASGQCVIANQALARITGGTREQLLQQSFRRTQSWRSDGLLAKAEAALASGQPQEIEAHSRTTFGRELVVNARFSSFKSQGEQHLLLMLTDETEATRTRTALRASEERYRTLAESSPDAIFILDRDIRIQYVNSTAAALWRAEPADLIGRTQAQLFPRETAQYHCKMVAEVFGTGKPIRRDERLAIPTGEQWIEIRLAPLYGEQGALSSVMGVCRDITERKRAERQLAEALDLNQKMIAASAMGIAAYKASGECIFANDALARGVGGSISQVVQGNYRRLESWKESGLLKLAEEVLAQKQARSREVQITTRFGKYLWMDCHLAPFVSNGQPHLLIMAVDISQRKQAEEALQEAQRLQKAILDNIADPVWLKDVNGRFLACNEALARVYGQPVAAIVGKTVFDFVPHEAAKLTREDRQILKSRQSIVVDLPLKDTQGQVRWYETIKSAIVNERGEVTGTVGASREITERKRAEEALKMQSLILQNMAEGALLLGPDQTILFANSALEAAFGYEPGELMGKHVGVLNACPQAETDRFNKQVSRAAKRNGLWSGEYQNRRKDGTVFTSEARVSLLELGGKLHYVSVQQDITERKLLERQILEISDREQARLGQDIHDGLCQHLVSLAFDANSLRQRLTVQRRPEAKTARRLADFLDRAITEARQLSRGLFPVRLEKEGLAPALDELARATRRRFKLQCRFEGKGAGAIENNAMATHLYRIAQEAVTNAVKHSSAQRVRIRMRDRADQLELRVEDNGAGISSAAQKKSRGMGLHIMAYRARMIGGTLHLKAGRRGGTVVSCCVPRPGH